MNRDRRLVLALVAVGLIVLGGGWIAMSYWSDGPPPAVAQPEQAVLPQLGAMEQWAQQAEVSRASVRDQLGEVDKADKAWNALPSDIRKAGLPPAVSTLETLQSALRQQSTALTSEIDDVSALRMATSALVDTRDRRSRVQSLVDGMPESADRRTTATELVEQRETLAQQCQILEGRIAVLGDHVRTAMAKAFPDGRQYTAEVVAAVMALVQEKSTPRTDASVLSAHADPRTRPELSAKDYSEATGTMGLSLANRVLAGAGLGIG